MKTAEILQRMSDAEDENAVLLFREGMFWRAYEHGAMALCEYVHLTRPTPKLSYKFLVWNSVEHV